ncbi:pilus (MSHA type) biogenesis protein MshL [Planctobacterium marinum]|uniref:Pilus (MSHA type) biogenesis protein MshL n=2 Tax=Planctobacterium marinum TaxID=1631968 RepID=A0AA48KTF3_9ALTE|nr:pilus (MSHA type) biogenesis protein MshL [Planctobacterium marinum]
MTQPAKSALGKAIAEDAGDKSSAAPLQTVPQAVAEALRPELPVQKERELFGEPRLDIQANQVDARTFFSGLVKNSHYSIAIHPDVQGNITLDLKQVRLQDVFEIVKEIYGYDVQQNGNIYRVFPSGMRTETFAVNYLLMQRDGTSSSSVSTGGVSQFGGGSGNNNNLGGGNRNNNNNNVTGGAGGSNGTSISTTTQTNFWAQLQTALVSMIGAEQGRSVVVSPQAGLVSIRAMPDELRQVRKFLQASQESVQRQVILEARVIELTLSDEYQQGINWTQILSHSGSTDFRFSAGASTSGNEITGALGGISSLSFINQDFSGVLSLLSTQGNVQVLSSPRVTALNNQKAVIKVGSDEYFVTDVSNQSTTNASTTSTTPDVELTPFFSGIALDVTPQIDERGSVLLHVHPSVIETEEQQKVVTINQEELVLPLAQSNIRESDTVIQARSGEIVVIGGLMSTSTTDNVSKTPFVGDIPLVGNLFRNKREAVIKRELVILIKPTVVRQGTWQQQLKQSQDYIADWLYVD